MTSKGVGAVAGGFRKALAYVGLAEEATASEEYYDEYAEPVEAPAEYYVDDASFEAEITPIRQADGMVTPPVVVPEPVGDLRRITTVHPRSYNDARVIGDAFRDGTPVIMNLTDMDDADAKRLVDFSAGLIFGLHGGIERVTNKVFLLSPEHVEVLGEENVAPPTTTGRFYNQS